MKSVFPQIDSLATKLLSMKSIPCDSGRIHDKAINAIGQLPEPLLVLSILTDVQLFNDRRGK